ncbi:DUF4136 domain-containing protein [candidate division GN15 bacterium]|nr:DUF4136 domain-containing protein [candidate division GN15 bacterium]
MKTNSSFRPRCTLLSLCCLLVLSVVAGCSSVAIKADYDEAAEFGSYATFSIMKPRSAPPGKLGTNPVAMRRIERAIESEMIVRGFRSDSRRHADLLVAYHAGVKDKIDVNVWGYRYGPRWSRATVRHYKEGTLVIDFIDREKKQAVWRGWATGVLSRDDRPQEAINDVVGRILEKYPPR